MKIAIDFDGTITHYPEFFTTLGRLFKKEGHEIYVLTGRTKGHLTTEPLPDQHITIFDINKEYGEDWYTGFLTWDLRTPQEDMLCMTEGITNMEKVARFKKRICEEYGIDIYFDDKGDLIKALGATNIFTV